jgi:hypothetical protein
MSPLSEVFDWLVGRTLTSIEGATKGSECITMKSEDGRSYLMYHEQDCCERVEVEDVCGEVEDLIGSPIVMAESVSNSSEEDGEAAGERPDGADDCWTWTFYKFATNKGSVTVRWFGTSNGYYSERVTFEEAK